MELIYGLPFGLIDALEYDAENEDFSAATIRVTAKDYGLSVSQGLIDGVSFVSRSGNNPDIDQASGYETIAAVGGIYKPPTASRIHAIASTSANDTGALVKSGTVTNGTANTLTDTSADFVASGVAAGQFVVNDTQQALGRVLAVTTTVLYLTRIALPNDGRSLEKNNTGDTYRVVKPNSTGVGLIWVEGLDSTYLTQSEFVILNGSAGANTSKSYFRINTARLFVTGSNNGAVGEITGTAATDATVSFRILIGNNQSVLAVYSVPRDKLGYLKCWWGSLADQQNAASTIKLFVGELLGIPYCHQTRALGTSGSSEFKHEFDPPLYLAGGVDVWINANSSINNLSVSAGFDIILVDA